MRKLFTQNLEVLITKSEVRSQKRCDPATTPVARERAPRESEVIFVTGIRATLQKYCALKGGVLDPCYFDN
ncbi:MAG: hypothetical protein F6K24_10565 [Okeania sp. SIO2D1]|nr:hypothetical protein [Okeania sp. SIO2D1]